MITAAGLVVGFILGWITFPILLVVGFYRFATDEELNACNCNRHKGER